MRCSVFNFLCYSVALQGQIVSKSEVNRERLHQHPSELITVYLGTEDNLSALKYLAFAETYQY